MVQKLFKQQNKCYLQRKEFWTIKISLSHCVYIARQVHDSIYRRIFFLYELIESREIYNFEWGIHTGNMKLLHV